VCTLTREPLQIRGDEPTWGFTGQTSLNCSRASRKRRAGGSRTDRVIFGR
jgi:hypothetical protein